MQFLRKNWALLTIGAFCLFLRFYNIFVYPLFTDESIYIYWAKFIATYHSHWFISIIDGKPPLLIWVIAIFLKMLPGYLYILAGRLPSILSGLIAVFGTYKLSVLLLKSKRIGYLAALLYAINPFTVFHDRMALFDSLLSAMVVWSVYFGLKTAKTRSLKDSILWGIFLGLAFLAKPTAIIFLGIMPLCFVVYLPLKELIINWKRLSLLTFIAFVISELFNNISRVSGAYSLMQQKNNQFQVPFNQIFAAPFDRIPGNFHAFFTWIIGYYTLPFFILGIVAFLFFAIKKWRSAAVLLFLWIIPIILFAFVGRIIFARYILFTTSFFLIPVAYIVEWGIKKKDILGIGIVVICISACFQIIQFDYYTITNPVKLSGIMPLNDYHQYIADQSSGYGIADVFEYINQKEKTGPVTVVTQGTFGLYPYAFTLKYWDDKNILILPRWPLDKIDDEIFQKAAKSQVVIILKEKSQIPLSLPLKFEEKIEKQNPDNPIFITSLNKQ